MEHPEYYKEPTLREKWEPFVFVLPLIPELLGLGFFITGTYMTFSPGDGTRLTHSSPASIAWQGLILFLFSLIAVLASVKRTHQAHPLHRFMTHLLSAKFAIVTLYIATVAQILAVVGFFFQSTCDWLSGALAGICCLVLFGLNWKTTMDLVQQIKARREAKRNQQFPQHSLLTGFNKDGFALNNDDHHTVLENEENKDQSKCLKVSLVLLKILFWFVFTITILITILCSIQPFYELIRSPMALPGEGFVKVQDISGHNVKIRYQCMGPHFTTPGDITSPAIIMEVGGGSGGVDVIGIQEQLSIYGAVKNFTVCTHDRAGYGLSW